MATLQEYAALSAVIYNDQRGGGPTVSNPQNSLVVPSGWINRTAGFSAQTPYDDNFFGSAAGAFLSQGDSRAGVEA